MGKGSEVEVEGLVFMHRAVLALICGCAARNQESQKSEGGGVETRDDDHQDHRARKYHHIQFRFMHCAVLALICGCAVQAISYKALHGFQRCDTDDDIRQLFLTLTNDGQRLLYKVCLCFHNHLQVGTN